VTDFPTMVYRVPGRHRGPNRSTYDYMGVDDKSAYDAALKSGWFAAITDALAGKGVISAAEAFEDAADNVSPATRDELEQKAKELGVSFNSRTSNETLAKRIAEALD